MTISHIKMAPKKFKMTNPFFQNSSISLRPQHIVYNRAIPTRPTALLLFVPLSLLSAFAAVKSSTMQLHRTKNLLYLIGCWLQLLLPSAFSSKTSFWETDANNNGTDTQPALHRRLVESPLTGRPEPLRILYTVTTLAEYDEGTRATTKGFDRLQNLLIPIVREGVESIISFGYHVDVFIVSHYKMTRPALLRDALPPNVRVRYWDDAGPLSYQPEERDDPKAKLWRNTLALARQHRFVVRDHLFDYDLFLNFEDDMVVHAEMVENHLQMTQALYRLREAAPDTVPEGQLQNFHGQMTKDQLKRCYPGLMRVEVLLDEQSYGTQDKLDPVPVAPHPEIDPKPCCHVKAAASDIRPATPGSDKMFLWETNIIALGVRHMEELGWVTLLRGPRERSGERGLVVADYWSGTNQYFSKEGRPPPGSFNHMNNEGGWMGTRQQIWEWHTEICLGGFLPPFEGPHYNYVSVLLHWRQSSHRCAALYCQPLDRCEAKLNHGIASFCVLFRMASTHEM